MKKYIFVTVVFSAVYAFAADRDDAPLTPLEKSNQALNHVDAIQQDILNDLNPLYYPEAHRQFEESMRVKRLQREQEVNRSLQKQK